MRRVSNGIQSNTGDHGLQREVLVGLVFELVSVVVKKFSSSSSAESSGYSLVCHILAILTVQFRMAAVEYVIRTTQEAAVTLDGCGMMVVTIINTFFTIRITKVFDRQMTTSIVFRFLPLFLSIEFLPEELETSDEQSGVANVSNLEYVQS